MENISKEIVNLPDGKYNSLWTGYILEILIPNNKNVIVDTINGVRGFNCKTDIEIKGGLIYQI